MGKINANRYFLLMEIKIVFSQVVPKLIMNSFIHGFKNKTKGSIIITVFKDIDFEYDGVIIQNDLLNHK